jgi:exosome complex component RRP4
MKAREIILPGELIEERKGKKLGSWTYEEGDKVFSKVLGLPKVTENEILVIPLSGIYLPKVGDKIIGTIKEVEPSGWLVDINSPYPAFLPLAEGVDEFVDTSRTDISKYFDIGEMLFCRISKVTKSKIIQVSMRDEEAKKIKNGITVDVTPSKIPRIIGKGGSMINMIKDSTGCEIIPGQNGVVWIRGEDKTKAIEAILTIENESHTMGLTEKIQKMLGI